MKLKLILAYILLMMLFLSEGICQPILPNEINGQILIQPVYESAGNFSEGLAPVMKNGKWGYVNLNGDVSIDFKYKYANSFSETFAVVQDGNYLKLISSKGTFPSGKEYNKLSGFQDGLALTQKIGEKKYGFIDKQEKFAVSAVYDRAKSFSEGLAPVMKDNKWGFINSSGTIVLQPVYEDANPFNQRLAAVKISGQWGFINKMGKIIISPAYERAGNFQDGFCMVSKNDLWGYIDSLGQTVIDYKYEDASMFSEGIAAVKQNGKWGYIDKKGGWVLKPVLDYAGPISEGRACFGIKDVQGKQNYGFISNPGKWEQPQSSPASNKNNQKKTTPAPDETQVSYIDCSEPQSGWQGEILKIHKIDSGTKKITLRWEMINSPYTITVYKGKSKDKKNIIETFKNVEYSGFKQLILSSNQQYITVFIEAKKADTQWSYRLECD